MERWLHLHLLSATIFLLELPISFRNSVYYYKEVFSFRDTLRNVIYRYPPSSGWVWRSMYYHVTRCHNSEDL